MLTTSAIWPAEDLRFSEDLEVKIKYAPNSTRILSMQIGPVGNFWAFIHTVSSD